MNTIVFGLFLIPILISLILKIVFHHSISYKEILAGILISLLLSLPLYYIGRYTETFDTQILNGKVFDKQKVKVSCSHSYSCHCHESCSGSGKNKSCTTICSTCYDHTYDYNWTVFTTVGNININRIDRQGKNEPPRFSQTLIGEPAAIEDSFVNYIKAAKNSLFHKNPIANHKYSHLIPPYPNKTYDYYRVNHIVPINWNPKDLSLWERDISNELKHLGPNNKVNIIIVFTKNFDMSFSSALEYSWAGGKKNDAIIIINSNDGVKANWVKVISWSKNKLFNTIIEHSLLNKEINRETFISTISNTTSRYFIKKSMQDYAYLESEIEPPLWIIIISFVLNIASCLFFAFRFSLKN